MKKTVIHHLLYVFSFAFDCCPFPTRCHCSTPVKLSTPVLGKPLHHKNVSCAMGEPPTIDRRNTRVKVWELAFDRPDMIVPYMRHAFAEDEKEDRETIFIFSPKDVTHSRLINCHSVVSDFCDQDPLELRFAMTNDSNELGALVYLRKNQPVTESVFEGTPRVSISLPEFHSDGTAFRAPICSECRNSICSIFKHARMIHSSIRAMESMEEKLAPGRQRYELVAAVIRAEFGEDQAFRPSLVPSCLRRMISIYCPNEGEKPIVSWDGPGTLYHIIPK